MLQLFSLTLLFFFFSRLITEPDTQTEGSKKQLERPKGSCQTVSCRLHTYLLLLFCYHVDICAWLCTCWPVFLVWSVCRHAVHFTPPFHSAFSSCVTSFFFFFCFVLLPSTVCQTLTTRVFPRLSAHVTIIWGAKKEKNLVQRWNLSELFCRHYFFGKPWQQFLLSERGLLHLRK